MQTTIDLNGEWQLRWDDGERGETVAALLAGNARLDRAWPAQVPGSVHQTLIEQGVIAEPNIGTSVLDCRWVEETFWHYRREFNLDALPAGRCAWLVFDCLDLAAVVYLNGTEVGRHANAFYPCRIEVTDRLRAGVNQLVVSVESGVHHAKDRSADGLGVQPGSQLTKRPWLRKTQSEHGWDWSPRLLNVGIPGAVSLELADAVHWDGAAAIARLADDLSAGSVTARVFVTGLTATPVDAVLSVVVTEPPATETHSAGAGVAARALGGGVTPGDGHTGGAHPALVHRVPVTIVPGENRLEAVVEVQNPRLWWPVGHGDQPRYRVDISIEPAGGAVAGETAGVSTAAAATEHAGGVNASAAATGTPAATGPSAAAEPFGACSRHVGFRHVRINQQPHPAEGRYFIVEVNHKAIFCKGGNLVPADVILSRINKPRYTVLVDRMIEANGNLLRVWGGGLYEHDDLYDLCDARGVLVWQEFVFACAKYPTTDPEYLADIKREAVHQVRRLAHHPSLIIWCGNNEMEWGNYQWGYERGVAHPDYALFHMVLPRILTAEDGSRYYQASSPWSPDLELPNADHVGDQHPWSVGFADTDFRKYRTMACRFPNEGGTLGPTALPTVQACTDRVGSFAWELHDNSIVFRTNYAADAMVETWTGRSPATMSLPDYVYWAGVVHGLGLAEYIKNFRRRMFDSAAAVFWMYNDVWPCVRSWTIVDYYLRRTPAFWPVRRAFAPLTIVIAAEGDRVAVYAVNDGPTQHAELRYGFVALAGGYPKDRHTQVEIAANASTLVAALDDAEWQRLGHTSHLAFAVLSIDGRECARDTLMLPTAAEMQWTPAGVDMDWDGTTLSLTSDCVAWRVCLDLDGELPLPDNFFDLLPGLPYRLPWPAALGKPRLVNGGNLR